MLRIKTELDKLEEYLINHRITYDRIDEEAAHDETGRYLLHHARHQICVPCKPEDGECRWDAICQPGSYGYEQGLLEIYGEIVKAEDGDSVAGWLTAEDVIKRLEEKRCKDCKNWRESHSEDEESYCYIDGRTTDSTDFCSWGERKEP